MPAKKGVRLRRRHPSNAPAAGTLMPTLSRLRSRPESFPSRAKCRGILPLLAPCLPASQLALRWSLGTGSLRRMLCSADCFHTVCMPWPRIRCSPPRLLVGLVNSGAVLTTVAVRRLPLPIARQLPIPYYSYPAQGSPRPWSSRKGAPEPSWRYQTFLVGQFGDSAAALAPTRARFS